MIGLFDSGMGGHNTLRHLRSLYPKENIVLLTDRKNSPYGTKSEDELVKITSENISTLLSIGVRSVLIGCCTASGVWQRNAHKTGLDTHMVESIIAHTTTEAESFSDGKIAVIATEASIRSHTFLPTCKGSQLFELATQPLVSMIDEGLSDAKIGEGDRAKLEALLSPLKECGADVLILGCTHFGALRESIANIVRPYGIRKVVDSAIAGAKGLRKRLLPLEENGITYYINT